MRDFDPLRGHSGNPRFYPQRCSLSLVQCPVPVWAMPTLVGLGRSSVQAISSPHRPPHPPPPPQKLFDFINPSLFRLLLA